VKGLRKLRGIKRLIRAFSCHKLARQVKIEARLLDVVAMSSGDDGGGFGGEPTRNLIL